MAKHIVYFDLETQKSFTAVGGSKNKSQMGISVGVAYSTKTQQYHIYDENDVTELGDLLRSADLVVGFNHIDFDYPVLQGYVLYDMPSQTFNLDMLVDIEERIGHRVKLDNIAANSLGAGKSADGLDALRWWQEYKKTKKIEPLMKIAEYCCYDVKVTKCVHEFGMNNGFVRYEDKAGKLQKLSVDW